jgi:hypothetical protein
MPKDSALNMWGTVILLPAGMGHGKKLFPFRFFVPSPLRVFRNIPDLLISIGDMDPIVMLILPNV